MGFFYRSSRGVYAAIQEPEEKIQPSPSFCSRPFLFILPWVTTCVFFLTSLYLSINGNGTIHRRAADNDTLGSFSKGWETDFGPSKVALQVEQVKFTGSPGWRENGSVYVPDPGPVNYVGVPSIELDEAWEKLFENRYFFITEEEARETWGEEYKQTWVDMGDGRGYLAGLDMFHTLHCLNQIRQMLSPDYYGALSASEDFIVAHRGHCIDQIRQYIMCSGDMTPIPTKKYDFLGGFYYTDSDYPHTCRNFGKIREWVDQRFTESVASQAQISRTDR